MKCLIIYFSLTDNTKKIAFKIQEGVEKAGAKCDIVTIKEADQKQLYQYHDYDMVGLGTPVHMYSDPFNVKLFIKKLAPAQGKHFFVFATSGTHMEYFFPNVIPRIRERGFTVIGMHHCFADCYNAIMPSPYPTDGHPDDVDFNAAEAFGRSMVENSIKISAGDDTLIPPVPQQKQTIREFLKKKSELEKERGFPEILSYEYSYRNLLKYHPEKCLYPKCQLCMDNCPMNGYDLSYDVPNIANPCMNCTFCGKICPTGAIDDSGWPEALAERTRALFDEFYLPGLFEPEAEGRFRKLIPYEEIGYDTPVYKKYTKHPYWIIGKGFNK